MDYRILLTVFGTIFLAELGDKTQLATMLFASNSWANLLTVFLGAWRCGRWGNCAIPGSKIPVLPRGSRLHHGWYLDHLAGL